MASVGRRSQLILVFSGQLWDRPVRLALFVLASGAALPIGLGLLGAGAITRAWWPRSSVVIALVGLVLVLASAVPVALPWYGLLLVAFGVWLATGQRSALLQRAVTAGLVVAGVAILLAALLPGAPARASGVPIFVLGDSLSAGLSEAGVTWPSALADQTGREVHNLARAGARLRDGLTQAESVPSGPSVLLVELGGNDILGGATPGQFEEALQLLLARLAEPERVVVMFELPLLPLQNRYGMVQREVCEALGVVLIPRRVLAGAVALPGHTTDGLHLSPDGHRWLATRVVAWI